MFTGLVMLILCLTLMSSQLNNAGPVTEEAEECKKGNQTDYCKTIFTPTTMSYCSNPAFSYFAEKCRVTCKNCAAFNCTDPLPENVLNCTSLANSCNDPVLGAIIRSKCPAECGTCVVDNGQTCQDVADAATCAALKGLCNDQTYFQMLTKQCPSTCNRCSTTTGSSKASQPPTITTTSTSTVPSVSCVDDPRCPTWVANGFCNLYTTEQKRQYCPKLCKLCP